MNLDRLRRTLALEAAATALHDALTPGERAAYAAAHPRSLLATSALDLHLKRGALHDDLGVPGGEPLTEKDLKRGEDSGSPLTRKRARLADTMRHKWHHASRNLEPIPDMEVAGKPLAHAYVGKDLVGDVTSLRGRFVFTPAWTAGPNVPPRFTAGTPEEVRIQLAERGLRVETAGD